MSSPAREAGLLPPESTPAKEAKEQPAPPRKTPRLFAMLGASGITVCTKWQSSCSYGDGESLS